MKKRLQRAARDSLTIAHDLLFVVGFVTGSRRVAGAAERLCELERRLR